MANNHRDQVLGRDIKAKQLGNLEDSVGNLRFFIKDELVYDLSQDFLDVRLDFALHTDDQIIELVQRFLFQVDFK